MLKLLVTPILALAVLACSSSANGSLIQVNFDDFANATTSTTTVLADGPFSIDRTISTTGLGFSGFGGVGVFLSGSVDVNYSITGGTFQDFFDAYKAGAPASPKGTVNPDAGSQFGGFGFDIGVFFPGMTATTVSASYDNFATTAASQTITSNGYYTMQPLADTSNVTFRLNAGIGAIVTLNSVSAVPEPTALMLVGSVVVGLCSIRRKGAV